MRLQLSLEPQLGFILMGPTFSIRRKKIVTRNNWTSRETRKNRENEKTKNAPNSVHFLAAKMSLLQWFCGIFATNCAIWRGVTHSHTGLCLE